MDMSDRESGAKPLVGGTGYRHDPGHDPGAGDKDQSDGSASTRLPD